MKDLVIAYQEQLLKVASSLYVPFIAFLMAMASVYLFGRMLGLVKTPGAKNGLAVITMVVAYGLYFSCLNPAKESPAAMVWRGMFYLSISIVLYTLIGFKLYDRVDAFLDKKIGPDDDGPITRMKRATRIKQSVKAVKKCDPTKPAIKKPRRVS